jgi:hypothetical protein
MQTGTAPDLHAALVHQITSQLGACDVAVTEDADLIACASAFYFHDLMVDVVSSFIMIVCVLGFYYFMIFSFILSTSPDVYLSGEVDFGGSC